MLACHGFCTIVTATVKALYQGWLLMIRITPAVFAGMRCGFSGNSTFLLTVTASNIFVLRVIHGSYILHFLKLWHGLSMGTTLNGLLAVFRDSQDYWLLLRILL
ncbi:hypothetical protein BJ912DRAFT_1003775 [Pholiota molesta]|nr:hypothetical protein BJ912DRAFT_1003775 [Pholiota molesta]